jgi:hypothetical protein
MLKYTRRSNYPSKEQLATLTKRGWRKCYGGLFWQSPYDKIFYSPAKAVVVEGRHNAYIKDESK